MQTYKATAAVGINPGAVVKLTDEQAAARAHAITAQGKSGTYLVRSRIEFKGGEIFQVDGDMPKNLADFVETGKKKVQTSAPAPAAAPVVAQTAASVDPEDAAGA